MSTQTLFAFWRYVVSHQRLCYNDMVAMDVFLLDIGYLGSVDSKVSDAIGLE